MKRLILTNICESIVMVLGAISTNYLVFSTVSKVMDLLGT